MREIVVVTLVIFRCALESKCRNHVSMKMKVHMCLVEVVRNLGD
jgi:hypothetical protein